MNTARMWARLAAVAAAALTALYVGVIAPAQPAEADTTCSSATPCAPLTGAGSTWAYNAIHLWDANMAQFGVTVNYQPNGSNSGRTFFADGESDFAASEIPYGVVDGANTDAPPSRGFAYMPDVAGATTLMYNLQINGARVTNLRLSGKTAADIFTNKVTFWDDPEIKADNPQLALPHLQITPVVRSDGSGATADFTQWMLATSPSEWQAYCAAVGRTPCTQTSTYPVQVGTAMIGQPGDPGVATYVAQPSSNGAIGYVEYSWALQEGFPVAKLLNAAGYYTAPTPGDVGVSLLAAQLNPDQTANLSAVYTDTDPRTYELSSYSYLIVPADTTNGFTPAKGLALGIYGQYLLCKGQSQVDALGYSALPINLVEAGFAQLQKVPGASLPATTTAFIASCDNPTFSSDGTNTLADSTPMPPACDQQGATQCAGPASTVVVLTASPNPATAGQAVTLTATVTAGSSVPAGSVQFVVGGTLIGLPVALDSNGVATVTTTFSAAGTDTVSAVFTPTDSGNQLGWTPTGSSLAPGVTLGGTITPGQPGPEQRASLPGVRARG